MVERKGSRNGTSVAPLVAANVLFPITLDDYVHTAWSHPCKASVISRVIADARGQDNNQNDYPAIRERMIRNLQADTSNSPIPDRAQNHRSKRC